LFRADGCFQRHSNVTSGNVHVDEDSPGLKINSFDEVDKEAVVNHLKSIGDDCHDNSSSRTLIECKFDGEIDHVLYWCFLTTCFVPTRCFFQANDLKMKSSGIQRNESTENCKQTEMAVQESLVGLDDDDVFV